MPSTITLFDTAKHHIYSTFFVTHPVKGTKHTFRGIIDTGAPRTEFSDVVLTRCGIIDATNREIQIKSGLQTQKYGKMLLPQIEICGQTIPRFEVMVSRLDESWGMDALIGLDFFRRFQVTINYKLGKIITEPL